MRVPSTGCSGMPADGDAPGCAVAIRARNAPGLTRKCSGGSNVIASPSTPARPGRRHRRRNPVPTTGARSDRTSEPVSVVRDEERRPRGRFLSVRSSPTQMRPFPTRAQRCRYGAEDGPQLGLTVALTLYRVGVEAQRHVGDEHPAVDLAASLPSSQGDGVGDALFGTKLYTGNLPPAAARGLLERGETQEDQGLSPSHHAG